MRQPGEPSVEEILASIKKVIARDASEPANHRGPTFGAGDVLDLGTVAATVIAPDADQHHSGPDDDGEPLTRDATSSAMRDSLAALAMLSAPGAQPQIVRSGETSLEGLVREMLRPMLAEWLDRNLPAMVDKLVAAEIARIAGKRG